MTLRTLQSPPLALAFFVWLWALATGGLRIVEAIRLRKQVAGDGWLALSGAMALLLGIMLFSRRMAGGAVGLAWLIAIPAVIWGIFEILLGWQLRTVRHDHQTALT